MPIYEFLCQKCHVKSSILVRSTKETFTPECPACGSHDISRVISSFSYHKSMQTVHEDYGEPKMFQTPDYYKDPRNIGRWTEKRFKDMDIEMPQKLQEQIQAAREGELPETLKEQL